MTRYFTTNNKVSNTQLTSGFEDEAAAKSQAEFLADTYGGTSSVTTNEGLLLGKYSVAKGWH